MTEYLLPTHANVLGNAFGGQIMAWMDLCAGICCQRHAGRICVTVAIDDLHFERPIRMLNESLHPGAHSSDTQEFRRRNRHR